MARRRDAGFTLIELLVVVLILGILVAIAAPKFLGARDGTADTTARYNLTAAAKVQTVAFLRDGAYVADVVGLRALEPELHWAVGATPTAAGAVYAHLDGATAQAVYLSTRTPTGGCWYLHLTPGATGYGHAADCPAADGTGSPAYAASW